MNRDISRPIALLIIPLFMLVGCDYWGPDTLADLDRQREQRGQRIAIDESCDCSEATGYPTLMMTAAMAESMVNLEMGDDEIYQGPNPAGSDGLGRIIWQVGEKGLVVTSRRGSDDLSDELVVKHSIVRGPGSDVVRVEYRDASAEFIMPGCNRVAVLDYLPGEQGDEGRFTLTCEGNQTSGG